MRKELDSWECWELVRELIKCWWEIDEWFAFRCSITKQTVDEKHLRSRKTTAALQAAFINRARRSSSDLPGDAVYHWESLRITFEFNHTLYSFIWIGVRSKVYALSVRFRVEKRSFETGSRLLGTGRRCLVQADHYASWFPWDSIGRMILPYRTRWCRFTSLWTASPAFEGKDRMVRMVSMRQ